jgi:phospholipid transport system substrate-binding protein
MNKFRRISISFGFFMLMLQPLQAMGGEATVQLRTTIDEFVAILVNTPVSELQATGLPDKALKLIYGRFDFSEMTKRSLGAHWQGLAQSEQLEFVDAFTQKLLMAYGRSVRSSGDEKVQFNRETSDGSFARVETKVVSGNGETLPIDYQLHDIDGQWKVYDMVIDQISIVNNYRAQFERVIAKSSVKELLARMRQQNSQS